MKSLMALLLVAIFFFGSMYLLFKKPMEQKKASLAISQVKANTDTAEDELGEYCYSYKTEADKALSIGNLPSAQIFIDRLTKCVGSATHHPRLAQYLQNLNHYKACKPYNDSMFVAVDSLDRNFIVNQSFEVIKKL